MATNWSEPAGADVTKVITSLAGIQTNANLGDSVEPGAELDLASSNRRDELLSHAIAEVRGAIRKAGRYPYSVTAGAVPPEGEWHTLVIAAWRLVNSTPSLAQSFLAEGGNTPLAKMYQDACEWVHGVKVGERRVGGLEQGDSFTPPSDPVGVDWATAVSDDNVAVSGIKLGDGLADMDEYDAGVTARGTVVSDLTQNMVSW